jgi:hypothetical protein
MPKPAKTTATNSHWVEASQISTPVAPNPAKITPPSEQIIKIWEIFRVSFFFNSLTSSRHGSGAMSRHRLTLEEIYFLFFLFLFFAMDITPSPIKKTS